MVTNEPILHEFSLMLMLLLLLLLLLVLLNLEEQVQGCGVVVVILLLLLLLDVVEWKVRRKIVESVSSLVCGFHLRR